MFDHHCSLARDEPHLRGETWTEDGEGRGDDALDDKTACETIAQRHPVESLVIVKGRRARVDRPGEMWLRAGEHAHPVLTPCIRAGTWIVADPAPPGDASCRLLDEQ